VQGLRPCYTSRIAKSIFPFLFFRFPFPFSSCLHDNASSPQLYLTITFPDGSGRAMDERESFNKRIIQLCSFRFSFFFSSLFSWNKTHITVVCCDQESLVFPPLSSGIRGLATARHRWLQELLSLRPSHPRRRLRPPAPLLGLPPRRRCEGGGGRSKTHICQRRTCPPQNRRRRTDLGRTHEDGSLDHRLDAGEPAGVRENRQCSPRHAI
jgi:hypothetical protein